MKFKTICLMLSVTLVGCAAPKTKLNIDESIMEKPNSKVINGWKIISSHPNDSLENITMHVIENRNDLTIKTEKKLYEKDFKYQMVESPIIFKNEKINLQIEIDKLGKFYNISTSYNAYPYLAKVSSNLNLNKIKNKCAMMFVDKEEKTQIIICNKANINK